MEKLLGQQRADQAGQQEDRTRFEREVQEFHRDPEDWKRRRHQDVKQGRYDDDRDYNYKKRKKGFDIFDIFD